MPKSILLIGPPGSGKTVALETLPGGTVDFNFDPGGWKSLDRPLLSPEEKELIISGKKRGRIPKKLKFAKTLREWLAVKENHLERDEILIIDYEQKVSQIKLGMMPAYSNDLFLQSSTDINELEKPICQKRGIWHIAVDSLTWWQWVILESTVTFRGPTKTGYVGTDEDIYGKAIEKMKEVIDVCCHLPFDFIYTAHIQSDKDAILGRIKEEIAIYGKKLPELIASMTDDIFVTYQDTSVDPPTYNWGAHPVDFLKAVRTRSFDNLPRRFEANFTKLYGDRLIHE
jgi:hypothetical protein